MFKKTILLFTLLLFTACGSSQESTSKTTNNDISGLQKVVIFEGPNGGYPPNTVTIEIDQNQISYSRKFVITGQVITEWSKPILFADYTSLRKIISDNDLYYMKDVTIDLLPPPSICSGGSIQTFSFTNYTTTHSFNIDPRVACKQYLLPSGVLDLINKKESLVQRYMATP